MAEIYTGAYSQCKWCGQSIYWVFRSRHNPDGSDHKCRPKVKHFTKEEIEQLNRERNLGKKEAGK